MRISQLISEQAVYILDQWGNWAIFVAAILEALPLVGILIPGHIFIFAAGFAAKMGVLVLWKVLLVATLGAVVGDSLQYVIGRKQGESLLVRYGKYFFLKPEIFEKTQKLVQKHPGKVLVLGRFNSVTRSIAPFTAGASKVPFLSFLLFDVVGGMLWAGSAIMLGYLFGASYELVSRYFGTILFFGLLLGGLIAYEYQHINKRGHVFERYHIRYVILNIFSLYIFAEIMENVVNGGFIVLFDTWVKQFFLPFQNDFFSSVLWAVSLLFQPWMFAFFSLLLLLYFLTKKNIYNALLIFFSFVSIVFSNAIIRLFIDRNIPLASVIHTGGFSFPSNPAVMRCLFFGVLVYSFAFEIRNVLFRWLFLLGNIFCLLLIGLAQIYFGYHWLSDVVAGYAMGIFWLTLSILMLRIGFTAFGKKQ